MKQNTLERDFEKEMMNIYHRAKSEANYTPSEFHRMLSELGGIETARRLINSKLPSPGYTRLWEAGHPELTVEAVVYENPKWHPLFDNQTLEAARKRLKAYDYPLKSKSPFYEWMIDSGLSESTALKYSSAIEGPISDWAREAKIIVGSILDITSQTEMSAAVLEIRKLPIFLERDNTGHHMYSSALKKYSKYLYSSPSTSIENDIKEIISDPKINETQKTLLVNARIGQGQYRRDLLNLWKGCSVTGFKDTSLLVASHIKPWCYSSDIERLDKFNGLLLLPNLDKAFDKGFISFDSEGKILISNTMKQRELLGIKENMSVRLSKEHLPYLDYHRDQVFEEG